mmetsp:Transcript_4145/g.15630  ORF Transcript_4145/g.15630 Transcript_4145/m.15630 type:complete len:136 (-) Transcript_4145:213-620(-)
MSKLFQIIDNKVFRTNKSSATSMHTEWNRNDTDGPSGQLFNECSVQKLPEGSEYIPTCPWYSHNAAVDSNSDSNTKRIEQMEQEFNESVKDFDLTVFTWGSLSEKWPGRPVRLKEGKMLHDPIEHTGELWCAARL